MSRSWIIMSRNMPPERLDVGDRRRAGIARQDRDQLDLADLAVGQALRRLAKFGSKRRLKPIISGVPAFSTTREAGLDARRSTDRPAFRRTPPCRPRAPRSIRSAWVSVGVQIRMASMSERSTISSSVATSAPVAAASALRRGGVRIGDGDEPRVRMAAALRPWIWPMRPAPRTAIRIMSVLPISLPAHGKFRIDVPV